MGDGGVDNEVVGEELYERQAMVAVLLLTVHVPQNNPFVVRFIIKGIQELSIGFVSTIMLS